jgi:1-deoxy-D-xylulose-5-phosphate reductoisomerase
LAKDILLLGSTGSIGRQTLEVVASLPGQFLVRGMAALGTGEIPLLVQQCRQFHPQQLAVADPAAADELRSLLPNSNTTIIAGPNAALELAQAGSYDICVAAIAGGAGFLPALAASKTGRRVALANKEALVLGGELFMRTAQTSGSEIVPIDSEHSAIHQCLRCGSHDEVAGIILTASGGALRDVPLAELDKMTAALVLDHPTWKMGPKVTIDSATMMNKGLEVIEAHWLFGVAPERIKVLIHPESVVHSLVEYVDGSTVAQLSSPDMRLPIQYALTWQQRLPANWNHLDLAGRGALHFSNPQPERYPSLGLAYDALAAGGLATAQLSGANEAAVNAFLGGKCQFTSIARAVAAAMLSRVAGNPLVVDDILAAECEGWQKAAAWLEVEELDRS